MLVGYEHRRRRGPPVVAQFMLLLVVAIATTLGVLLALQYPKFEPACGPQPRYAVICQAPSSHDVLRR